MFFVLVSAVPICVAFLFLDFLRRGRAAKAQGPVEGLPMVPKPHWLFGHVGIFQERNPTATQRKLFFDHANTDGVCSFWLGSIPCVSVTRTSDARAVLRASSYRQQPPVFIIKHIRRFFGPKSIIATNGKEWKFLRLNIHRAFTPSSLSEAQEPMVSVASTLSASLLRRLDGESSDQPLRMDVFPLSKMATVDVFGRTALGQDFGCCEELRPSPVAEAFDFLSEELTRRIRSPFHPAAFFYQLPTPANRRHAQAKRLLRDLLERIIKSRREADDGSSSKGECQKDLLSHLLRAQEENEHLVEKEMMDTMLVLLYAGYDTTSVALAYAFYCLATNPEAEARCVEEVEGKLLNNQGDPVDEFDPDDLVYCRAVILETLRLYPSAPATNRTLEKPLEIGSCTLPSGTNVYIPIWSIQRDERNFPRPMEFFPERWASRKGSGGWVDRSPADGSGGDNDISKALDNIPAADRDSFLAFSGGARSCVGRKFAMQEAVIILAVFVRDLKFECEPGYSVEPQRTGLVQSPRGGMPMMISRRR